MTAETYNNLRSGDRLIVELDGRLRVARVRGWECGMLLVQLHRVQALGWCSRLCRVPREACVQVTYTDGQTHIAELLSIGGDA